MLDDETDRGRREAAAAASTRFDSIDDQLRVLTRLVEQVLERLPQRPDGAG